MISPQRIETAFRDIERLLANVEEIMLASRSHSPFNDYLTQLSPEQHRMIDHGISELRTAMICILRGHGIVANDPHINTCAAIRKTLGDAADRLRSLNWQRQEFGNDESSRNDEETAKLLRQMISALIHMDQYLAVPEPNFEKKVNAT